MSGSSEAAGFVGVVLVLLFFALYREWHTPEVVVFLSLLAVWNVGIISTAEALSGFSNPGVLSIGGLFVVVASIENSRLADKAAKRIFGLTTSFRSGFFRLLLCSVAMSAFCNNTPILALLIPVTKDWARTRGYDHAVLLMPLAFACAFGGMLTTVGGGTNLVIQGLLYEAKKEDGTIGPFRLFDPAYVGLPLAIAGLVYLLVAAPRVLGARPLVCDGGMVAPGLRDRSGELVTELEVMEDFDLVGQSFELMLATLDLPAHTLVEVRRRQSCGDVESSSLLPTTRDVANGDSTNGGGGGCGTISETCSLEMGGEDSTGSSWTDRMGETNVAGGSGHGLFARRRRTAYRLLESDDGDEPPTGVRSPHATNSCVEMATLRRTEGVMDGATSAEGRKSTRANGTGGGNAMEHSGNTQDAYCDVTPADAFVRVGDVFVLSAPRDVMISAQGSMLSGRRAGLKVLGVSALDQSLQPGSLFMELVLSRSSGFLGLTARLDNGLIAARYGCSVVAFRLKGSTGIGAALAGHGKGRAGETFFPAGSSCGNGSGSGDKTRSREIELSEILDARGTPEDSPVAAVATSSSGDGATDGCVGGRFGAAGNGSISADGGARSAGSATQKPFPSPFATGRGLATPPLRSPREKGLDEVRPYGRRRRRRRGEAFEPGDIVMVVATERFSEQHWSTSGEFLSKKLVGRLPEPMGWFHCVPLALFALMLAWVLLYGVDMIRAVFAVCGVLILGGWVDAKQAVGHVNWSLLVLIGSALGFSKAMANSGLADAAGAAVRESGMSASASLYALFGLTMLCTELISNNAAAALNIPVALSMSRELQANYKPFAMTVLVAASCSFLTPIGTPTNTLVWAPGGYKFQDYFKLGAPLCLLFWVTACAIIPQLFPF